MNSHFLPLNTPQSIMQHKSFIQYILTALLMYNVHTINCMFKAYNLIHFDLDIKSSLQS